MLKNLFKAVVSAAASVPAAVADAVMMVDDGATGKEFAPRTSACLRNAGDCFKEAVKKEEEK